MGLFSTISGAFGRFKFATVEHSPEIFMIVGTVSLVGSIVTAATGAVKFQEHLDKHNERLAKLDAIKVAQNAGTATPEEMAINVKEDRMHTYIDTAKNAIITFAPAIGLGVISICSFFGAAGILKSRYVKMAGAFAGLMQDHKFLENRIVEEYGEDKLHELKMSKDDFSTVTAHVDEETGEVKEETVMPAYHDQFSRWFDEGNPNWVKNAESNRIFLEQKEKWANKLLLTRGKLFLNEVYEMLDYDQTQAGQFTGWVDKGTGYGQVSFGMYDPTSLGKRNFINGCERSILLNFNVEPDPIIGRCGYSLA